MTCQDIAFLKKPQQLKESQQYTFWNELYEDSLSNIKPGGYADVLNRKNLKFMLELLPNYQKVLKTFVFERQTTNEANIVDKQLDLTQQFINLNPILNNHCPLGLNKVSIYSPSHNSFIGLKKLGCQNGIFHRNLLEPTFLLFRFREKLIPMQEIESEYQAQSSEKKDQRSKERTVFEVIDLVRKWRNLHQNCTKPNKPKKKLNLQEAAVILGVSKKSLDDYYCQLRLAEQYHFDFKSNMHEKMGILRAYVKQYKVDEQEGRPHRNPKHLKIINSSQFYETLKRNKESRVELIEQNNVLQCIGETIDREYRAEKGTELIDNLQNQFFKGFQFLLDDPTDPFIAMNKDFSKKILSDDSEGFLFE